MDVLCCSAKLLVGFGSLLCELVRVTSSLLVIDDTALPLIIYMLLLLLLWGLASKVIEVDL